MAVVVLLLLSAVAHAEERGAIDWIFLVDTSQSMRGVGGSKDIFGEVKSSIGAFVREASVGDSVTIFTFDRDVQLRASTDIRADFDRAELLRLIADLRADGNRTHLGAAIAKGVERADVLSQRNDASRERAIVLFTDGREDVRGIRDPISIPSNLQRAQKIRPWIFFVSLGEHEAQLDDFASETERTTILKPRDAEAIRELASKIRHTVAPPEITFEPRSISFGSLRAGETTEAHELILSSDKRAIVSVALETAPGVKMQRHDNIIVTPSASAHLRLRLTIDGDAEPGARELHIRISGSSASLPAIVAVTAPSPLLRIAKWLGVIAILLLLALIGFVLYSGKSPGELIESFSGRNHLEGEIEVVAPRMPPDAMFVGLPTKRTKELAISAIVPTDALGGSDARLFCRRRSGTKTVWIAADKGTLRVNDIELPMTELYDADTIEVGDAKLRFNRVGHERPSLEEDRS